MEVKSPQSQRTVTHTNAATMRSRFKLYFFLDRTSSLRTRFRITVHRAGYACTCTPGTQICRRWFSSAECDRDPVCVGRRARGSESEGRGRGERSFHIFWFQLSAAATVKQKRRLSGENGDRIDVSFEAVCWGNFAKLEVWNDLSSKIWPDEQLETAQLEVSIDMK